MSLPFVATTTHGLAGPSSEPRIPKRALDPGLKIYHVASDPRDTNNLIEALAEDGLSFSMRRVGGRDELTEILAGQHVDLLLVDNDSPTFVGLSVLKLVRSFRAAVPVILLSSVGGEEAAIDAIKAGASDFVLKSRLSRLGFCALRAVREAEELRGAAQITAAIRAGGVPYQRIVDTAREGIWVIDADGVTIYANQRIAEMLGYTVDEMLGRSFFSFTDDEGRKLATLHMEQRRLGISEQHEFRFQTKSGDDLWVIIATSPLLNEHGVFLGALGMVTDITDRRRADEALRTSEAQLRSVFENAAIGICLVDMSGQIIKANPALLRMLGLTPEEISTSTVADLTPLRSIAADEVKFRELVAGRRETFRSEHRIHCKGGRELWGNISVSLVRDDSGVPLFVIAMVEDVTLRKRLAEQLARSERRFRELIEKASDLTMLLDPDGTIRYASPAAASITGYAQQEIIGQPLFRFLPPNDTESLLSLNRLRRGPEHEGREELRILQKNGATCIAEVSATGLLDDGDGGAVALNFRDITERYLAASLRLAKEEAERASQAKSEFLSRMSHELRTPMNAILGFAQVLHMSPDATPKQVQRTEYILNAGQHLLNLINEVLNIARIESGKVTIAPEPVDARELIAEALEMVQPLAVRRHLKMNGDADAAVRPYVMADRQQLRQVLLNLIANAVKYNRDGGSVAVSYVETKPGRLRIQVRDTGHGIAPEKMSQLFVPFERLGAERSGIEGAGLGLALAKRQIELMGGAIGVDSTVGEGSTFWVELPLTRNPTAGGRQGESHSLLPLDVAARSAPCTVLYIEDNASNIRLMADITERWPAMKLMAAGTGEEGLAMAREHDVDLILLDVHLPDMTGGDVLRRLKEAPDTRDIPVVIISADATESQIERQLAAGAKAYLTKPMNISLLMRIISELIPSQPEAM